MKSTGIQASRTTLIFLLACVVALAGCDGGKAMKDDHEGHEHHAGEDDHDHGSHGHDEDEHGEGDGHDHGHEGHADEVSLSEEAIKIYGVRIDTAKKRILTEAVRVPGRIDYNIEKMAHISAQIDGWVTKISVRLGDLVEKGDVLYVVNSPSLGEAQGEFLQKRAELEVAKVSEEVASISYERAKKLIEGKGVSESELLRREGEFKGARGAKIAAEASVQAAENKLHLLGMSQSEVAKLVETGEVTPNYEIRAPISGAVVRWEATIGEAVGPDRETLMILADVSGLWLLADIPERRAQLIGVGSSATFALAAQSDQRFEGRVSYVAPEYDADTRTVAVRIEVDNSAGHLRPGMFADVEIMGAPQAGGMEVLAVWADAVQRLEGGHAVFVPEDGEPGTFKAVQIKPGPQVGGWMPILGGIEPGQPYVRAGSFVLKAELGKEGVEHEH